MYLFCNLGHGSNDAQGGESLDLKVMIHKIHNGNRLIKQNYNYADVVFDFKSFSMLGDGQRMCTVCHDPALATSAWPRGKVIADEHRVRLPDDLPGEAIDVRVGLYQGERRMPVSAPHDDGSAQSGLLRLDPNLRAVVEQVRPPPIIQFIPGELLGDELVVREVLVERPDHPVAPRPLFARQVLLVAVAVGVTDQI